MTVIGYDEAGCKGNKDEKSMSWGMCTEIKFGMVSRYITVKGTVYLAAARSLLLASLLAVSFY